MAIILKVSLVQWIDGMALDVDETGSVNFIPRANVRRKIVWQLIGDAASGEFLDIGDKPPGFEWLNLPPNRAFGVPEREPDKKHISITDLNNDFDTTKGEFIYTLRMRGADGKIYSTRIDSGMRVTTNPAIINR